MSEGGRGGGGERGGRREKGRIEGRGGREWGRGERGKEGERQDGREGREGVGEGREGERRERKEGESGLTQYTQHYNCHEITIKTHTLSPAKTLKESITWSAVSWSTICLVMKARNASKLTYPVSLGSISAHSLSNSGSLVWIQ